MLGCEKWTGDDCLKNYFEQTISLWGLPILGDYENEVQQAVSWGCPRYLIKLNQLSFSRDVDQFQASLPMISTIPPRKKGRSNFLLPEFAIPVHLNEINGKSVQRMTFYRIASTGLAWKWFEKVKGTSPADLEELYQSMPEGIDLETQNLLSGIQIRFKKEADLLEKLQ